MADIDVERDQDRLEPDYTVAEMILWVVGIVSIPAIPIIMIWLLTPWSGM